MLRLAKLLLRFEFLSIRDVFWTRLNFFGHVKGTIQENVLLDVIVSFEGLLLFIFAS